MPSVKARAEAITSRISTWAAITVFVVSLPAWPAGTSAAASPGEIDACKILPADKLTTLVGPSPTVKYSFNADIGQAQCTYSRPTTDSFGMMMTDNVVLRVYTDASITPSKYRTYNTTRELLNVLSRPYNNPKPITGVGDAGVFVANGVYAGRWILTGTTLFQVHYLPPVNRTRDPKADEYATDRDLEKIVLSSLHP